MTLLASRPVGWGPCFCALLFGNPTRPDPLRDTLGHRDRHKHGPRDKPHFHVCGGWGQGAERGWNPHSSGRTCFLAIVSLQYSTLQCSKKANARPLRRTMPGKMTAESLWGIHVCHTYTVLASSSTFVSCCGHLFSRFSGESDTLQGTCVNEAIA